MAGAALVAVGILPSVSAGAVTARVDLVDGGTTFTGVVTVGANAWAYAQGGCGSNPGLSHLDEFTPYGTMLRSIDLGSAELPCPSPSPRYFGTTEPISTNGTLVAVLNGDEVTVIDGATGQTVSQWTGPPEFQDLSYGQPSMAFSGSSLVLAYTGLIWVYSMGGLLADLYVPGACSSSTALAVTGGLGVVACPLESTAYTIDLATGEVLGYKPLPLVPMTGVVAAGGSAYFPFSYDQLLELNVFTLPGLDPAPLIPLPLDGMNPGVGTVGAMALVGPDLWVGSSTASVLWPVDVATGSVGAPVDLPSSATSIAGEGTVLWVALAGGGLGEIGHPAPLLTPSTVTLSAPSGASPVVGSSTTLTATLSTPGTVTFYDGSSPIAGCASLAATTTATCVWTPSSAGASGLSATLAPSDATYLPSTSPTLALSVAPEPTTVTPSFPTGSVASGRVSLSAAGSVPGTMTFSESGSLIPGCVGLAAPSGSATCEASLGAGSHQVTVALAPYSANDAPSSATRGVKVVAPLFHGSVPFERGSSDLDANGRRILAHLVRVIVADGYTRVSLFGRGDGEGTTSLARARAATVAAVLRHELSGVSVTLSSPPSPSAGSQVIVVASL